MWSIMATGRRGRGRSYDALTVCQNIGVSLLDQPSFRDGARRGPGIGTGFQQRASGGRVVLAGETLHEDSEARPSVGGGVITVATTSTTKSGNKRRFLKL